MRLILHFHRVHDPRSIVRGDILILRNEKGGEQE